MIREYAVEPRLLATWERFRYITEKFGVSEGRLISRYPKNWIKKVYDSLEENSEIKKSKIEVKLKEIKIKLMKRILLPTWDRNLDWYLIP